MILTSLLGSLLVFSWYWTDSTARAYRRSQLLNVAIIAVGFLAVPYYLLRSRERGRRLPAFARLCGFVLLMAVATVIGASATVVIS